MNQTTILSPKPTRLGELQLPVLLEKATQALQKLLGENWNFLRALAAEIEENHKKNHQVFGIQDGYFFPLIKCSDDKDDFGAPVLLGISMWEPFLLDPKPNQVMFSLFRRCPLGVKEVGSTDSITCRKNLVAFAATKDLLVEAFLKQLGESDRIRRCFVWESL